MEPEKNIDQEIKELKNIIMYRYRDGDMTLKEWLREEYLHGTFNFPIKIKLVDDKSKVPTKKEGKIGWDCYIHSFLNHENANHLWIESNQIVGCKLGFKSDLTEGFYAQVVPRRELAKHGITLINSPEIINSSFREEWIIWLGNCSSQRYEVNVGDNICQFIIRREIMMALEVVNELSKN